CMLTSSSAGTSALIRVLAHGKLQALSRYYSQAHGVVQQTVSATTKKTSTRFAAVRTYVTFKRRLTPRPRLRHRVNKLISGVNCTWNSWGRSAPIAVAPPDDVGVDKDMRVVSGRPRLRRGCSVRLQRGTRHFAFLTGQARQRRVRL